MKKTKMKVLTVIGLILLAGIYYYVKLPAINIHAAGFWTFLLVVIAALAVIYIGKKKLFRKEEIKQSGIAKGLIGLFVLIGVIYLGGTLLSSPIINAKKYQKLLTVEEGDFQTDIKELPLTRFRFWTGSLQPFLETERWEAWWTWCPSLKWMSSTARSTIRTSRSGYRRFAMRM